MTKCEECRWFGLGCLPKKIEIKKGCIVGCDNFEPKQQQEKPIVSHTIEDGKIVEYHSYKQEEKEYFKNCSWENPWTCNICKGVFYTEREVKKHIKEHHAKPHPKKQLMDADFMLFDDAHGHLETIISNARCAISDLERTKEDLYEKFGGLERGKAPSN